MAEAVTLFESKGFGCAFSFGEGAPGKDELDNCSKLLQDAASTLSEEAKAKILQPTSDKAGDPAFLELLAAFLSDGYGQEVSSSNLVRTNGASGGMLVLMKLLFPTTKPVVFVEEYSYWIGLEVLRSMGCTIVPVRLSSNGVDADDLKTKLRQTKLGPSSADGLRGLLYLIPHHQNPTNSIIGTEMGAQVVEICRKERILILCDDVYNLLHFRPPLPGRLFEHNTGRSSDVVVSNGSFSKVLGPGLRLGWLELPGWLRKRLLGSQLMGPGGLGDPLVTGLVSEVMRRDLLKPFLADLLESYEDLVEGALGVVGALGRGHRLASARPFLRALCGLMRFFEERPDLGALQPERNCGQSLLGLTRRLYCARFAFTGMGPEAEPFAMADLTSEGVLLPWLLWMGAGQWELTLPSPCQLFRLLLEELPAGDAQVSYVLREGGAWALCERLRCCLAERALCLANAQRLEDWQVQQRWWRHYHEVQALTKVMGAVLEPGAVSPATAALRGTLLRDAGLPDLLRAAALAHVPYAAVDSPTRQLDARLAAAAAQPLARFSHLPHTLDFP